MRTCRALVFLFALLLLGSMTLAFHTRTALAPYAPAGVLAGAVVALTNEERTERGVPALTPNEALDRAAQAKAEDMAAKGYYAHVAPDGRTPMHWVSMEGYEYRIVGENLVVNRTEARTVIDAFMGSSGHRANILRRDFTEIGVGVATGTYKGKEAVFTVQLFAAPYPKKRNEMSEKDKENVKRISTISEEELKPRAVETAVLLDVPRPSSAARLVPYEPAIPFWGVTRDSVGEKDKIFLKSYSTPSVDSRPFIGIAASTTPVSSLRPSLLPIRSDAVPAFQGVSRLGEEALPVPVGSTWSQDVRLFAEGVLETVSAWMRR